MPPSDSYEIGKEVSDLLVRNQESDRGCVIFCAALLEDELEALIRAYCRKDARVIKNVVDPLFKGYAPLSTFSGKIQICYAFGLIPEKLYRSLTLVRKLRNAFAHEKFNVSFQLPKHRPLVQEIFRSVEKEGDEERYPPVRTDYSDDDKKVPNLGMTKKQLVDRLAFCWSVARMVGSIKGRQELAPLIRGPYDR